jgi:hypothetical protein
MFSRVVSNSMFMRFMVNSRTTDPTMSRDMSLVSRVRVRGVKFFLSLQPSFLHICNLDQRPRITNDFKILFAYVFPVPAGSKAASHPNCGDPLAGTMFPSVLPSNNIGSDPGPALYANVHSAQASLVENPTRRLLRPWCPSSFIKYLIYGPGRPFKALKQRAVSSVIHGTPSFELMSPGNIQPMMDIPIQRLCDTLR